MEKPKRGKYRVIALHDAGARCIKYGGYTTTGEMPSWMPTGIIGPIRECAETKRIIFKIGDIVNITSSGINHKTNTWELYARYNDITVVQIPIAKLQKVNDATPIKMNGAVQPKKTIFSQQSALLRIAAILLIVFLIAKFA